MFFKIIRYLFWAYLVISLFIYIFYIPPFEKPDENLHFLRAVSVSQGNFICKTDKYNKIINQIPISIYQYVGKNSKNINPGKSPFFVDKENINQDMIQEVHSCVLPFFYYLATGASMAMLRVWHFSPEIIFYSGRLINAVIVLLIVFLSLKGLPLTYQLISLYVFSWPMVLYQISSYSKDAYFIALGLYLFNRFIFIIYHKKLNNLELILFIISLIFFILARPPYIFFGILLLVILKVRTNQNLRYFNKILFLGTTLAVFLSLWFLLVNKVYITPFNTNHSLAYYAQINPQLQFIYVLTHPINYLLTFLRSLASFSVFYLKSCIGIFGYLSQPLPNYVYIFFLLIGAVIIFVVRKDRKISFFNHLKNPLIAIIILTVGVLFSAMYLYSSPVGAPLIYGIQGRYLINLVPLIILLLAF